MQTVIELLTFKVSSDEMTQWIKVEEEVWTAFLKQQPGFMRKELWYSETEPDLVKAVIWWQSIEQWRAITKEQCDAVDKRMGQWLRSCTMQTWQVIKEY